MRLPRFRIRTLMIAVAVTASASPAHAVGGEALVGTIDVWPVVWAGIVLLAPVVTLTVVASIGSSPRGWPFAWCWGIAVDLTLLAVVSAWAALDLGDKFFGLILLAAAAELAFAGGFCIWLAYRKQSPPVRGHSIDKPMPTAVSPNTTEFSAPPNPPVRE